MTRARTNTKPRKNLGLRASPEKLERLQDLARAKGTSLQAVFDQLTERLLDEQDKAAGRGGDFRSQSDDDSDIIWRELFLQSLPGVAAIKDALELKLLWVNQGYEAMTGQTRKQLIGKTVGDIWATRDRAKLIQDNDREALSGKGATVHVETVNGKWGKVQRLRIRFPIYDRDGIVRYLGAIGFDYDEVFKRIQATSLPDDVSGSPPPSADTERT